MRQNISVVNYWNQKSTKKHDWINNIKTEFQGSKEDL